ncbi:MAG: dienelactone hydrolase family protein [Nitrososphaerota archaeon]|nr:dienelactone hydrolase family protein [Nitrososphaerota archaeon]MDG7005575.1 dienelactone hydrolase family protein [Nitrososphaerota archaeon]
MSTKSIASQMTRFGGTRGAVDAYLSRPETGEPRPAVVIIHEAWGLVDHTKDVADRFAREGYVALAPDLFSSDPELASILSPKNIGVAMGFMQKLSAERRADMAYIQQELAKEPAGTREVAQRVMAKLFGGMPKEALTKEAVKAVEYLNSQSYVESDRIGTVGFCFGGGMSINIACHTKTAACIVFYGENPSPIELVERIQCPVLGLYGGEDMRINSSLDKLVAAMVRYGKDFQMKVYPGAPHAFFNDTNKATYREAAARDAWERTSTFFRQALRGD